MSLRTPEKVEKLQAALHAKAKGSPGYRFYALYDKVYRGDVLEFAYRLCLRNGGAPGVDGERFEDIEAHGLERWLGELTEELRNKAYRPQAVRRHRQYRIYAHQVTSIWSGQSWRASLPYTVRSWGAGRGPRWNRC